MGNGETFYSWETTSQKTNHRSHEVIFGLQEINWIEETVWSFTKWSFFDQLVRNNNNAWVWHNRINERAVEKLNLLCLFSRCSVQIPTKRRPKHPPNSRFVHRTKRVHSTRLKKLKLVGQRSCKGWGNKICLAPVGVALPTTLLNLNGFTSTRGINRSKRLIGRPKDRNML